MTTRTDTTILWPHENAADPNQLVARANDACPPPPGFAWVLGQPRSKILKLVDSENLVALHVGRPKLFGYIQRHEPGSWGRPVYVAKDPNGNVLPVDRWRIVKVGKVYMPMETWARPTLTDAQELGTACWTLLQSLGFEWETRASWQPPEVSR